MSIADSIRGRSEAEEALRRIDELVAGLAHLADPAAREAARNLAEAVLDMHGLALARIIAVLAADEQGRRLMQALAGDEQVKAVLLLYGLHPDDPETRLRQALAALTPRLGAEGAAARVAYNAGTGGIAVRVFGAASEALRREIEEAIVNAAPDLDEVAVEWLDIDEDVAATAPAG
ncbi:MAG: hypothetical protein ACM3JG_07530 [Thiohalocapsa sp.]